MTDSCIFHDLGSQDSLLTKDKSFSFSANAAKKEAMLSKSESIVTIRSTSSHPIAAAEDDVEEILVADEVIPPTSNST